VSEGVPPTTAATAAAADSTNEPAENAATFASRMQDDDFRKKSYFWFGALSSDPTTFVLSWKGSFLGYTKTRPTAEELQWSRNYFDYSGPVSVEAGAGAGAASSGSLRPVSGKFAGSYVIGDASGATQEKLFDSFELDFRELPGFQPTQYSVVGIGTSEVGKFVLDGAYDSGSRALALSRMFVRDSDALGSAALGDLRQYHGRQLSAIQESLASAAAAVATSSAPPPVAAAVPVSVSAAVPVPVSSPVSFPSVPDHILAMMPTSVAGPISDAEEALV
jgi:hypothetical protein